MNKQEIESIRRTFYGQAKVLIDTARNVRMNGNMLVWEQMPKFVDHKPELTSTLLVDTYNGVRGLLPLERPMRAFYNHFTAPDIVIGKPFNSFELTFLAEEVHLVIPIVAAMITCREREIPLNGITGNAITLASCVEKVDESSYFWTTAARDRFAPKMAMPFGYHVSESKTFDLHVFE